MRRALIRRSGLNRNLRFALFVLTIALLIDTLSLLSYHHQRVHHASLPIPQPPPQRIFITSTHWNNERILRSHWNTALLKLVQHFGPSNLYISIYESGSWDNTKGALRELDTQLEDAGVPRKIVLDPTSHKDELTNPPEGETQGWLTLPDHPQRKRELRRIPYLARLRNLALAPLLQLLHRDAANDTDVPEKGPLRFDKILFLNDVVFTTNDILTLLSTNNGDYAAACALDFAHAPAYYDTFALRDSRGHEAASNTFPFFRSRASRAAILAGEPVPVQSCWNGAVMMDAAPFYEEGGGLRFRGVDDSLAMRHVEGSECCLVHKDNPLSGTRGVWVNPAVRVGYSGEAYDAVHHAGEAGWPGMWKGWWGVWRNRGGRLFWGVWWKERRVRRRVEAWKREKPGEREEKGVACLINEMQVLRDNGWAHV